MEKEKGKTASNKRHLSPTWRVDFQTPKGPEKPRGVKSPWQSTCQTIHSNTCLTIARKTFHWDHRQRKSWSLHEGWSMIIPWQVGEPRLQGIWGDHTWVTLHRRMGHWIDKRDGLRPIHPNEQPPPAIQSPQYDDSDNGYEEAEEEPKYLRIHRTNPIPDSTPQYKKNKRAQWLTAEQKKHEKSVQDKAVTHYYQVLVAWEKQPGKIPSWLETVEINRHEERDNTFWGMYGPGFIYLEHHNVMLTNNEIVDAACILDRSQSYWLLPGIHQRPNPCRFPIMPHEACHMVGEVRGYHPWWKDSLHLLGEFHHILSLVRLHHHNLTMQMVFDQFVGDWVDILTQY